jgi:hypothetical protein
MLAWHGENLSREQGGRHCIVVVKVRLETEKVEKMKNRVQADFRTCHCGGGPGTAMDVSI